MTQATVVVDAGPIVAAFDARDPHHAWAVDQFRTLRPPLLTCEAVLSEAAFLLARASADPTLPVALVERGVLEVANPLSSTDDARAVGRLMKRYGNVPMSLADACLVRIVEITEGASVFTLDSDFRIYRQRRRRMIPVLAP